MMWIPGISHVQVVVKEEEEESLPNVNQPNVEELVKEKLPKEERIRKPEEDVVK